MIMLAMVLEAMNIPVDMIMIIYGIDRLFDMGRTCLNITGDISCACCVTKWESKKAAQTAKYFSVPQSKCRPDSGRHFSSEQSGLGLHFNTAGHTMMLLRQSRGTGGRR